MLRKCGLFLAFASLVLAADTRSLDGIDAFADQTLKDWKCVGVAIAVIQDGKVILSKGYGQRDQKHNLPVTPKTLFAIGSSTKSFTVTSLGVLADQGKLDWDKPVRDYLPEFRLMDQFATERMTPRDLVTHRSGLPRHDLLWYNSPLTRAELFERLRYLEPSKDFRTTFQYQNLMFMTAGYLAAHLSDMSWEAHVRKAIFEPLGMSKSNFSVTDSQKSDDYSLPYSVAKEEIVEIPFRNIDQIGPAGSINSNVEDMARYVMMHMARGKGVLSARNANQMQSPQMSIAGPGTDKELGAQSYGMGFFLTSYRGHYLVHHGGNIDGFSALVTFMPQDNIGMIILTNQNGSSLPTVLSYNVYDRLLGLDQIDWTRRMKDQQAKAKTAEDDAKKKGYTAQRSGTRPSHDLEEYAGEYEHPGYGVAKVAMENGALTFRFNGLGGPMQHFHYDVFEVAESQQNPLSKMKVQFHTNLQGDLDSLALPLEATVKEVVFTRLGDKQMTEKTFLQPLTGNYQRGAGTVTVALKTDHALSVTIPGQGSFDLVPVRGTKFDIKGLTGYAVEFKGNDLVFYQPNGTFSATKKP
ncbi:MAG TPA: serine hydrolase [Bryobacteraceae bacterium]|nr:serine hydrolase [Bryobacteraceae bacterium]